MWAWIWYYDGAWCVFASWSWQENHWKAYCDDASPSQESFWPPETKIWSGQRRAFPDRAGRELFRPQNAIRRISFPVCMGWNCNWWRECWRVQRADWASSGTYNAPFAWGQAEIFDGCRNASRPAFRDWAGSRYVWLRGCYEAWKARNRLFWSGEYQNNQFWI